MARLLTSPIGSRTVREGCAQTHAHDLTPLRADQFVEAGLIGLCSDCTKIPFSPKEPIHEVYHPTPKADWCARCEDIVRADVLIGELCPTCVAGPRPPHLCKDYLRDVPRAVDMRDTIRGAKTHGL